MRRLLLLLVLVAGLVSAGTASATITMTQGFPTYYGSNGTGGFETDYTVHNTSSTQTYMIVASSMIRIESSPPGTGFRNVTDRPADYDSWIAVQGDIHGYGYGTLANTNPPCPYPGFHQFFGLVYWQSRVWVPQLGLWTNWSTLTYSTNGNFIYGQVCL